MNDAIRNAYTQVCAEIDKLQAVKTAMERAGVGTADASPPRPNAKKTPGPRAPKGTLEQAIKGVLKGKGRLVNGEIRVKLKAGGYKYSLGSLHVGKTLSRLVASKQLGLDHNGSRIEYSLK